MPDPSDRSATLPDTRRTLLELEALLRDHPDWCPPYLEPSTGELVLDPLNEAALLLYSSGVARAWRQLVPSALALEALALGRESLPRSGLPLDDDTRRLFLDSDDARAVRTRGRLMATLLADRPLGATHQTWISLAGGAARPVLQAAAEVLETRADLRIDVVLVDSDAEVLEYASTVFDEVESPRLSLQPFERDLRRDLIASGRLVDELGAGRADVVDVLGFLEYCADRSAVALLRTARRLLRPGGVLITSNMRSDRPQRLIHERAIGWPGLQMRSVEEFVALLLAAGFAPSGVEVLLPTDGVYAVARISAD